MSRDLIIGGITVSQDARISINQTYKTLSAISNRRLANGSLVSRNTWNGKLETMITCTGYIPSGLQSLDYTSTMTVSCIAPKGISSASNAITLPTTRRTDAGSLPFGRKLVNGKWEDASSSLVGDVLTITLDASATQYQAVYFPEFTAIVSEPNDGLNIGQGFSWSIKAEQV